MLQVEVQPGWRANAQLLAREECNVVEFEIRTTIGCPKGKQLQNRMY